MDGNERKQKRSFGTHDGTFHADEVTACALLVLFNLVDRDKINRSRDPAVLSRCEFVCDVGGHYNPAEKQFDHHQADYHGHLSSAGMVLKYLNECGLLPSPEFEWLNDTLIRGIDAHDNGRDPLIPGFTTFSNVISNFTPIGHDCTPAEQTAAFRQALDFTIQYLTRLRQRYAYTRSCREIVKASMDKNEPYLLFDENIPWIEMFFELGGANHPAQFVIMPADQHWKLRGIPPSMRERMKVRIPLPQEWAGLINDELKRTSGIEGAIFCHRGRFISVWETKEDAFKALAFTFNQAKEQSS